MVTLVTLGVSDARFGEGKWLIEMVLSGITAHTDICWEVATSLGVAKTGLSGLSGSSALMVVGAPKATDIGLPRVVSPEAGLEVSSAAQDKSS